MKGDVATALWRGVDSQWKKYRKADFLQCDRQGNSRPKERGFKTKCTCDQVERLPQPASPLLFIERDKQAPALSVLLQ